MNTIVKSIEESNLNNLDEVLLTLAYQNSVCIEYEASNGNTVSYNTMMVGCGLDKNISSIKL